MAAVHVVSGMFSIVRAKLASASPIAFVLIAGFLLRISGISWGIPLSANEGWYHPDEHYVFDAAIWSPGVITELRFLFYPTFFPHVLSLLTLPLRPFIDPLTEDFRIAIAVVARLCSVFAGTGAIYVTYRFAKDLAGERVALLAAALLCFSLYHAQNSAFGTTDVLTSLFLVLFVWQLRRGFVDGRLAPFVWAGVALGLLVGSKYTGALAVVVVPVFYGYALLERMRGSNGRSLARQAPHFSRIVALGLTSLATFAVTTPGVFLDPAGFLGLMQILASRLGWSEAGGDALSIWTTVYSAVVVAIGWPLTWLAVIGIVASSWRGVDGIVSVVLFVVFFGYLGDAIHPRYVITVMPLLSVIAARGAATAVAAAGRFRIVPVLAVLFVILYSSTYSIVGAYLRHHDTRTEASRYLRERFPRGTGLGIGYTSVELALDEMPMWMNPQADYSALAEQRSDIPAWWSWFSPGIDFSVERLKRLPQRWSLWQYPKVDDDHFRYVDLLDYPEVVIVTEDVVEKMEDAMSSGKLSSDGDWDRRYNHEWYWSLPPSPRVFEFYRRLLTSEDSPYTLARTIRKPMSVPIEFGSPEIRVYVASSLVARYQRERAQLSRANVHYYAPYSTRQDRYPANPRGYFHETDVRSESWVLRSVDGAAAHLQFPKENRELIRVVVDVPGAMPWHAQMTRSRVVIRRDHAYVLSFRARSTAPRTIGVGVGRTHGAWDDVGLYRTVDLDTDWQSFRFDFSGTADEDTARIHFDFGTSEEDVELERILLEIETPGGVVPVGDDELRYAVDYRFNGMGCRDADYSTETPGHVRRILVLGNSWAVGGGLHEEDTLSGRLDALLASSLDKEGNGATEVINCGVNDYDERDARLFYQIMASHYHPDVVMLLVAPPFGERPMDVSRVYVPRHLSIDQAAAAKDRLSRRGAGRTLDPVASAEEIGRLADAVAADDGRLIVLLVQHDGDSSWENFVGRLAESVSDDDVEVWKLESLWPADRDAGAWTVLTGFDNRPNELAIRTTAAEIHRLLGTIDPRD